MPDTLPPELERLLAAEDPASRDGAWTAFISTFSPLLLHVARSTGRDYDAAMDRYAFVLEQLRRDDCRRLRAYVADGRSKFTTWLVVVARRLCLDHHRQRYGRARGNGTQEAEQARESRRNLAELVAGQVDFEQLADPAAIDPESDLAATEQRQALEAALAALEPRDRMLLRLRFEDELSAPEIARVLDFPTPFHVYRRLNHLFGALRQSLRSAGIEDPVP